MDDSGDIRVVVEGDPVWYYTYYPREGLDILRTMAQTAKIIGIGIKVYGNVGANSLIEDTLREAGVPSIIVQEG